MKKIYGFFVSMAFLTLGLNAQVIKVQFEGEDVSDNDTLNVEVAAGEEVTTYFILTNQSSETLSLRSAYSRLKVNEGDEFLMCFGECTTDTVSAVVDVEAGTPFNNFDIAFTSGSDNSTLIEVFLMKAAQDGTGEDVVRNFYVKYANPDVSVASTAKTQPLSVDIYPNPMSSNASINYFVPAKYGNAQLLVRNMVGKTVKTFNLRCGENAKLNISSTDLANGVYFYSIVSNGTTLTTKKLVVRK